MRVYSVHMTTSLKMKKIERQFLREVYHFEFSFIFYWDSTSDLHEKKLGCEILHGLKKPTFSNFIYIVYHLHVKY